MEKKHMTTGRDAWLIESDAHDAIYESERAYGSDVLKSALEHAVAGGRKSHGVPLIVIDDVRKAIAPQPLDVKERRQQFVQRLRDGSILDDKTDGFLQALAGIAAEIFGSTASTAPSQKRVTEATSVIAPNELTHASPVPSTSPSPKPSAEPEGKLPSEAAAENCGQCITCLDSMPPDGDPLPRSRRFMVLCTICGNKRCPHATDHRHACTGSNESGQPGSRFGPAVSAAAAPQEGDELDEILEPIKEFLFGSHTVQAGGSAAYEQVYARLRSALTTAQEERDAAKPLITESLGICDATARWEYIALVIRGRMEAWQDDKSKLTAALAAQADAEKERDADKRFAEAGRLMLDCVTALSDAGVEDGASRDEAINSYIDAHAKLRQRAESAERQVTALTRQLEEARPKRIVGDGLVQIPRHHVMAENVGDENSPFSTFVGDGELAIKGRVYLDYGIPDFTTPAKEPRP